MTTGSPSASSSTRAGKVVTAQAFYDSIIFNDLWRWVAHTV
jgi:hypothetical protein